MEFIEKWDGKKVGVARSKGGVVATVDYKDNLVASGIRLWPPPEIVQKLYKSNQQRHFADENGNEVTRHLGYYSDLQSLHSEDAITWSIFGPLIYSSAHKRKAFVEELFDKINVPFNGSAEPCIWLWRRYPHPDSLVSGGPEIDFAIQTDKTLLLGEAKWLSKEGRSQGKDKNKTQFDIRKDFITKYGQKMYPQVSSFVILGLDLDQSLFQEREEESDDFDLHQKSATWSDLCHLANHPLQKELIDYLCWKLAYSRIREPAPTPEEQQKAIRNFLLVAEKIINLSPDEVSVFSPAEVGELLSELKKSCLPVSHHEHKSAVECIEKKEILFDANLYKIRHLLAFLCQNIRQNEGKNCLLMNSGLIKDIISRLSYLSRCEEC
ncbi:hypothetical protein [Desulfogranum marinum]|uniref:hypothetical protein n=1 Tax=Desulfogranum marinum TaxID=453220 RepID=UPI001965B31D|nr:hypothetical protein [Desulfogranum marinum]MBM9512014.1 hypothetical protein [Desulfogranum marinum]